MLKRMHKLDITMAELVNSIVVLANCFQELQMHLLK